MTDSAVSWHDRIAKRFEQRYSDSKLFRDRLQVWSRFLLSYCNGSQIAALDLGCGAGNFSILLARHYRKLVCVDGSESMAQLCRDKLAAISHSDIEVVVEDLNTFCVSTSARFDIICCSSVLEYIDDLDATLVNIGRCLEKERYSAFFNPNW